eukprot:gene55345-58143_t
MVAAVFMLITVMNYGCPSCDIAILLLRVAEITPTVAVVAVVVVGLPAVVVLLVVSAFRDAREAVGGYEGTQYSMRKKWDSNASSGNAKMEGYLRSHYYDVEAIMDYYAEQNVPGEQEQQQEQERQQEQEDKTERSSNSYWAMVSAVALVLTVAVSQASGAVFLESITKDGKEVAKQGSYAKAVRVPGDSPDSIARVRVPHGEVDLLPGQARVEGEVEGAARRRRVRRAAGGARGGAATTGSGGDDGGDVVEAGEGHGRAPARRVAGAREPRTRQPPSKRASGRDGDGGGTPPAAANKHFN